MANCQGQGRVAIITGATSGIGIYLAKDLYAHGWKVACVGRRREAGEALVKSLGENARFFQADLEDYASQARMFKAVYNTWGHIDALCANAGIVDKSSIYILNWRGKDVNDIPPEPDLSCTDIDYKGVVYGTQLAIHFMRQNKPQPGGKIVVTGSIGGVFPHRSYPEYCGAKSAVITFIRGVAPLLKQKDNIFINTVLPGIVATPIVPPEMIEAVTPECITPVETVIRGYHRFLDDDTGVTGQVLEASADKLVAYDLPEMGNGRVTKRAVTVWEPLFRTMHGEDSGLPDAIP
ncbi:hypothetical protein DTO166G4_8436 [Paecilomyces variotii]|nr:hypothetical protein DTO166G4_8436 [Paecilomyces variotii]KAJ9229836.1 hypothetical protein DTO166G5_7651 [Paecilomyces variotii]KAJ9248307.1 hypothetical protein DTO207G8_7482 [Paecilomyces variotii]KAJ9253134.1 hypothetical protein DTO195F2_7195 [Paecilomyces variotii]KAJ9307117.1 hypothetical protein DTO217A2_3355 [Paecilomyces variotii]